MRPKRSLLQSRPRPRPTPPPTSSSWAGGRGDRAPARRPDPVRCSRSRGQPAGRTKPLLRAGGAPGHRPWIWDYVVSGERLAARPTIRPRAPSTCPSSTSIRSATVAVRIRMGTVSPGAHTVDAEINGVSVGSVTFAGPAGSHPLREHPRGRPPPHRQHPALVATRPTPTRGASSTWGTSTSTRRVSAWLRSRPCAWALRAPAHAAARRPVPHRDPPGLPPRGGRPGPPEGRRGVQHLRGRGAAGLRHLLGRSGRSAAPSPGSSPTWPAPASSSTCC